MEGFDDYHALAGYDGAYNAIINYDGQNHVIKNFVPMEYSGATVAETNYYYCTSIFGVPSGVIKNLGVVDAYVSATQGAGVLGAYAGHGSGSSLTVENVYVTGEVYGEGGYTGGLFGTTGNLLIIKDSFFNGSVNGSSAYLAGFVGRLRNEMEVYTSYVAGSIESGFAIADTDKAPVLYVEDFVSFVEGAELCSEGVDLDGGSSYDLVDGNEAALIEVVQDWAAFSSTEMINGYPALDAFNNGTSGIFNEAVEEVEANGPAVYYNLQGVQVANPENGVYIVRRGNKVSKELVR